MFLKNVLWNTNFVKKVKKLQKIITKSFRENTTMVIIIETVLVRLLIEVSLSLGFFE